MLNHSKQAFDTSRGKKTQRIYSKAKGQKKENHPKKSCINPIYVEESEWEVEGVMGAGKICNSAPPTCSLL
jgi:hypothetical protein